jgi:hypothetical protein
MNRSGQNLPATSLNKINTSRMPDGLGRLVQHAVVFPLSPRGVVNQVHVQLHRGALAMAESLSRTMSR